MRGILSAGNWKILYSTPGRSIANAPTARARNKATRSGVFMFKRSGRTFRHVRSGNYKIHHLLNVFETGDTPDSVKVRGEIGTGLKIHAVKKAAGELRKIGDGFGCALDYLRLHDEDVDCGTFVGGAWGRGR